MGVVSHKPVLDPLACETDTVRTHHRSTIARPPWFSWLATVATVALLSVTSDARALPCPVRSDNSFDATGAVADGFTGYSYESNCVTFPSSPSDTYSNAFTSFITPGGGHDGRPLDHDAFRNVPDFLADDGIDRWYTQAFADTVLATLSAGDAIDYADTFTGDAALDTTPASLAEGRDGDQPDAIGLSDGWTKRGSPSIHGGTPPPGPFNAPEQVIRLRNAPQSIVPEPSTLVLLGVGAAGWAGRHLRRPRR